MLFSSLLFLFRFLPLVLLIYFLMPRRGRNLVLLLASLIFYTWGEPVYVVLMLLSTVVDYTAGRTIAYGRRKEKTWIAKLALGCSLTINLSLLGVFKYADFVIEILNGITPLSIGLLNLALPIGISFYTFQTMSYTIDVYRGEVEAQKNIIAFGAFVSSFPQLIAGPVVRYKTVAEELKGRRENADDIAEGVRRFVTGLAKKVILANTLGEVFSEISAMQTVHLSTLTAWIGILAYTFQIYFDFSGYSDMAIGLGRMFGFHFLENFDHPYESKSVTEFWRRWHISMGTWFREYVYIPLGGNRGGLLKQMRNIAIVWFLTGLWHGASWNFILWGLYYGAILVLEKLVLKRALKRLPSVLKHLYTMLLVIFGWAIFAYADMADGMGYFKAMFGLAGNGLWDGNALYLLLTNAVLFVLAAAGSTSLVAKAGRKITGWAGKPQNSGDFAGGGIRKNESGDGRSIQKEKVSAKIGMRSAAGVTLEIAFFVALFLLSVSCLVNSSYNPFLYFRF